MSGAVAEIGAKIAWHSFWKLQSHKANIFVKIKKK